MRFGWKCVAVGAFAAAVDVLWSVHLRALCASALLLSVSTVVAIQYMAFFGHLWFVECPEFSKRFAITTAGALGAGLGTAIVLLAGL
jgi:hypothetical protein